MPFRGRSTSPARGVMGWLTHPIGGTMYRGYLQYPAFASASSEVAVGFFIFFNFLPRICPRCSCTQLCLAPCSFLASGCLRRRLSRCKQSSAPAQGPGSQPVSVLLIDIPPRGVRVPGCSGSSSTLSIACLFHSSLSSGIKW